MDGFQAIVVRPTNMQFSPNGTSVPLKVWLPHTSGDLTLGQLESLQKDFDGELEIVPKRGRAIIIQTVQVCSREGISKAAKHLARKVRRHLKYPTTIQ